jgi:hypothetical protein
MLDVLLIDERADPLGELLDEHAVLQKCKL